MYSQYNAAQHSMVQSSIGLTSVLFTASRRTVQYSTVRYSTVPCGTGQCSAAEYDIELGTERCSVQYSTRANLQLHVALQASHHHRTSGLWHLAGDGRREGAVQQLRVLMRCPGLSNACLPVPLVRIYLPHQLLRILRTSNGSTCQTVLTVLVTTLNTCSPSAVLAGEQAANFSMPSILVCCAFDICFGGHVSK